MTSALERGGRILIALIVVNAVAAATALLTSSGGLGETEARILLSTITITFAAAGGLICLTHWQRIGANAMVGLPGSGLLAIGIALIVVLYATWSDTGETDDKVNAAFSTAAVALGLTLVNLLFLATVPRDFVWTRLVASLLIGVTVLQFMRLVWYENGEDGGLRLFFASVVLTAGACVVVGVFDRLVRPEVSEGARYCPRCGSVIPEPGAGRTSCTDCGASFRVEFSAGS